MILLQAKQNEIHMLNSDILTENYQMITDAFNAG